MVQTEILIKMMNDLAMYKGLEATEEFINEVIKSIINNSDDKRGRQDIELLHTEFEKIKANKKAHYTN